MSVIFAVLAVSLFSCAPQPITQATEALNAATLHPALPISEPTLTVIPDEPNFYKASILTSSLENASQKEIVGALIQKWLEYHKTNLVNEQWRLKDYKIEKIKVMEYCPPPDKNTTKFLANVEFSVQTVAAHPSDWLAFPGNTVAGEDHWIYHLSPVVSVSTSNGIYTLGFEGVPPC